MRYAMLVVALVVGCGAEVVPTGDGGMGNDAAPVGDAGPVCNGERPTPTFVCCGEWVDPINDAENCGACGIACEAEQACRIGRCE
jgi:hypothetical protein